jgi:hypothetical protein
VAGTADLGPAAVLYLDVYPTCASRHGAPITQLAAHRLQGRFARIAVRTPGYRAEPVYIRTTLAIRLRAA